MTQYGMLRRTRRGVGFIWFCLIALPVLFFSAGMSVDLARVVVAHREASNLTSAAAIAGAFEFKEASAFLDTTQARREALATWTEGQATVPLIKPGAEVTVTFDRADEAKSVTVQSDYEVDGLIFITLAGRIVDDGADFTGTVKHTASVCIPGNNDPTSGYCSRPLQ